MKFHRSYSLKGGRGERHAGEDEIMEIFAKMTA